MLGELSALAVLARKAGGLIYRDPVPVIFCANEAQLLEFLRSFRGARLKKPFGQYLIQFDADNRVKSVRVLARLDRQFGKQPISRLEGKRFCTYRPQSNSRREHARLLGVYCIPLPAGGVDLSPFGP